jgi:predicted nucleotidyltransferase
MEIISEKREAIVVACKQHHVNELFAFGSVLTDSFRKESDVDMLVGFEDVDQYEYFDNYMDFKESLENIFKRKVDLVEIQSLKNPILKRSIDRNKLMIYGRKNPQVVV